MFYTIDNTRTLLLMSNTSYTLILLFPVWIKLTSNKQKTVLNFRGFGVQDSSVLFSVKPLRIEFFPESFRTY